MKKLGMREYPAGSSAEDFECFGPVAQKDTEFTGCKMADFGCFKQDEGTDSNKMYHAAVVRHKTTKEWFLYVEWGRTTLEGKALNPQFQFTPCANEAEALAEFCSQCAAKNTKRGVWEKVGSKERYVPKTKKDGSTEDLYVVRYMATRAVGLPAARNICNQDAVPRNESAKKVVKKATKTIDTHTKKLFKDLLGGAVSYTRSTMVGGTLPALSAITDARDLLQDALAQVKVVGNKLDDQVKDSTLKKLTYNLYGMVPKAKPMGAPEKDWILSQDNIRAWQDDLDAFETALKSGSIEEVDDSDDVMAGIPADVSWIDPQSEMGKWLTSWWTTCTRSRHGHGKLTIHNLWEVRRHGDSDLLEKNVAQTATEMPKKWNNERPMFHEKQKERPDLTAAQRKAYWESNTNLTFHGSRSVNIPGIIRESFRFPKELVGVVITGAFLGGGVYQADDYGKSANYCSVGSGRSLYAGSNGHVGGRKSFMFACDSILGHPHVAPRGEGFTKPPTGHHSVFGKTGYTETWGYGSTLQNNEWVLYSKNRTFLRYLAELSWY